MRVYVYRNLHNDLWSIRALEGEHKGRVVAHARAVTLMDVEFRVSEAGRQRVLREHRKNVHAGAVGTLLVCMGEPYKGRTVGYQSNYQMTPTALWRRVAYNPYRFETFVLPEHDDMPAHSAVYATLDKHGHVYAYGLNRPNWRAVA